MLLCTVEPPAEALKAARGGETLESRIRLDAGDLDPTFGDRGKVVVPSPPPFGASAFVIQDDGAFVLGGSSGSDFAVTRLHADGRLDTSFGMDGWSITDFGLGDGIADVAVQVDGRIVVAGWSGYQQDAFPFHRFYDFALARYHPDGRLDTSFGSGGLVVTDFGADERASAIAIQSDGKIVVSGSTQDPAPVFSWSDFAVARYHPDGTLDASFGIGGMVTTTSPGAASHDDSTDMVIQDDGKILAAGSVNPNSPLLQQDFAVVRYLPDGSLDGGFGDGGIVSTHFAGDVEGASSVALLPDGRIVVTGSTGGIFNRDFALLRYNADGSLDTSFGSGGFVRTEFSGRHDFSSAIVVQPDGRLLVTGSTSVNAFDDTDAALVRYHGDGSLDTSFGDGGKAVTDFGTGADRALDVGLQPSGKAVTLNGASDVILARYLTAGLLLVGPVPGTAGAENRVGVGGATPGATVRLYGGATPGRTLVPGCPEIVVAIADAIVLGDTAAGPRGTVVFRAFVPEAAEGTTLIAQAVERSTCTVSNLLIHTFVGAPSGP